jgi:Zn-dependent peptidase ImmA (M78 family)/transcriptional regulator with XRE-family HTH domain
VDRASVLPRHRLEGVCTVDTEAEALGAQLARARDARKLSQDDVAALLSVSRVLVSHWERGQRQPSAQVLERLAEIYGVELQALLEPDSDLSSSDLVELLYRDADGAIDVGARTGLRDFVRFLENYANLVSELGDTREVLKVSPFGGLRKGFTSKEDIRRKVFDVRDWLRLGLGPVGDLPGRLDDIGITVYRTALGKDLTTSVSGAFVNHRRIGMSIAVNVHTTPGRQLFTLSHELAHALFHSDQEHLVSAYAANSERERFADYWAGEFLVPLEGLRRQAEQLGIKAITDAEEAIHLQRHFGVSYGMILFRLRQANLLNDSKYEELRQVSPVLLASRLGYSIHPEEWHQDPDRRRLERFPRGFLRLLVRGLRDERLSPVTAASLTGLTIDEIAELISSPVDGDSQVSRELQEYEDVRERAAV